MARFSRIHGDILDGVSATTLWTLRNRAVEAKRSDGVIRDPWAITVFDAIDYDYDKFGRASQFHALRARTFDAAARDYLATHPKASVVALAEGLQTSFSRLDRDQSIGESTCTASTYHGSLIFAGRCCPPTTASSSCPSRRWTEVGWTGWTLRTACSSPRRDC